MLGLSLVVVLALTSPVWAANVLTWQNHAPTATAVNIERKAEACAATTLPFLTLATVGPTVTTYTDPVATPGTYCYRVNAMVVSAYSNLAEKTLPGGESMFAIGDRVAATTRLNVRPTPTVPSATPAVVAAGVQGVVLDGPRTGETGDTSAYTWWRVQYDSGVIGWSAGAFLTAVLVVPVLTVSIALAGDAVLPTITRRASNTGMPPELLVDHDTIVKT